MPTSSSANKRVRQDAKKALLNKAKKSRIRTEMKKFQDALKDHSVPRAQVQLQLTTKLLDKAVKTNLLHKNNVARKKSKMARALHELQHRHADDA